MQKAAILVPLLVLGWSWTLQALPVLSDPLYPTEENFDLTRFLGTWYDVAVATTCSHAQRHKSDAAAGKMVLENSTTPGQITVTRTTLRHGECKEMILEYELTPTPGRFYYEVLRWGSNAEAYVVHTNYNEYAIVISSKHRTSGDPSISVKLYSRTRTVRDSVLEDFKTLAAQEGLGADTIIIKQDKGDCVPGETVEQPEPQRVRRDLVPTLAAVEEGSGVSDDSPLFVGSEACKAAPDSGPCFGIFQRYFYNSSSMSCELFNFGGCLGNQNNFQDERECLQRCRTEAVCRLPMVAQPCTGQPKIWAFDSTAGLCVAYKSGFCQSNGNKFYTKAECEEYCGVVKDDVELLQAN